MKAKSPFKSNESFANLAEQAIKKAVSEVVKKHIAEGRPLHVWQDGKVVAIPANQLEEKNPHKHSVKKI